MNNKCIKCNTNMLYLGFDGLVRNYDTSQFELSIIRPSNNFIKMNECYYCKYYDDDNKDDSCFECPTQIYLDLPLNVPIEHQKNILCYLGDLNLRYINNKANVDKIYKKQDIWIENNTIHTYWYCDICKEVNENNINLK